VADLTAHRAARRRLLIALYEARLANPLPRMAYVSLAVLADLVADAEFHMGVLTEAGYVRQRGYAWAITAQGCLYLTDQLNEE
jgi:hypothetical protein